MKKHSLYVLFTLAASLFYITQTFAHGENMPGPHGGFIRMPGAFHTEVIPQKTGFEIMLLDINFQHPSIKDSSVNAAIKFDHQSTALRCKLESDHFFCAASKELIKKAKTLELVATREKAKGAPVEYALPLKRG